jgi:hypothetical protein
VAGEAASSTPARAAMPHSGGVPTIANGMDVRAIISPFMDQLTRNLAAGARGAAALQLDTDELNQRLAALPETPDEGLR